MTVNLGTLLYAEQLNKGVQDDEQNRQNLGFALACFYGADRNCGLTIEDLIDTFNTAAKYKELLIAVKDETNIFNGINDEFPVEQKREDQEPKKD